MLRRMIAALGALALASCASLGDYPPVYGCEGIPDYCPNQPPQ